MPYFETVYFLKLIQILSLQKDEMYYFLHDFAHTGDAIDKKTLVKALHRNSAVVFTSYAEFCFSLTQWSDKESSNPHYKFFGSMLVEVLKASGDKDQTTMFNLLPFIAKSLQKSC
jgi:hypothetical protein